VVSLTRPSVAPAAPDEDEDEVAHAPTVRQPTGRRSRSVWWVVLGIMVVSVGLECWALQRDLPYSEVDEPVFVRSAVQIAATGDLDPHWFGHPGSTTIYPLAGLYHVWDAVAHGGPVFSSNPALTQHFRASPTDFYVIGRLWSIAFAVAAIPLIFLLGRRCFSAGVGLVGASLWALLPLVVYYGREVRTDSAAVFFTLLSILLIARLVDRPTLRNHVLAGISVGLGVASRYFLVTLIPVLVAAGVIAIRRKVPGASIRRVAGGVGAAVVGFALATPYFFLDWTAAHRSLAVENGPHVGHDGFSPLGNLRWYVGNAIPDTLSWPIALLAVAGIVLVLVRPRDARRLLLLAFSVIFLVAISVSKLHWHRWFLPILPVIVLLAAYALVKAASAVQARAGGAAWAPALIVAGGVLVSIGPARDLVRMNMQQARPSTRVVARTWMARHVPPGSAVAREVKTAPLEGMHLRVSERYSLPQGGRTLDDYRRDGFQYLVINGGVRRAYTSEPDRYRAEADFYGQLGREACLLHVFWPRGNRYGPTISVYQLMPAGARCEAITRA
jgi:4-amino-4-deoxy-L-arabinose transferase-like glycosyltransferase